MPIERMTLNIPDAPLKDLFTWLPREGGKEDFHYSIKKQNPIELSVLIHRTHVFSTP